MKTPVPSRKTAGAMPIMLTLVSLLLSACQPTITLTEPAVTLTATPVVSPAPTPTAVTVESATPAMPTAVAPTEPSPTPTVEPPALIPTPTSETSPLPTAAPERAEVGNADVTYVRAVQAADPSTGSGQGGTWTFHVTVQHPDTGWEDYADGWDVLTLDGTVIKPDPDSPFTRLLTHPHVDEQPFTRSQSGIAIPDDVTQVRVRAHDLVDGYGGREVLVDLTIRSGPDFEVERGP